MFDKDRVDSLKEEIVNALRPLGITVPPEVIQLALQDDQIMVMMWGIVREDAASKTLEQRQMEKETTADLNTMLAEQHRQSIQEQISKIKGMAADEASLEQALFGEADCEHPNVHPEGFCIDCGEAVEDE